MDRRRFLGGLAAVAASPLLAKLPIPPAPTLRTGGPLRTAPCSTGGFVIPEPVRRELMAISLRQLDDETDRAFITGRGSGRPMGLIQ